LSPAASRIGGLTTRKVHPRWIGVREAGPPIQVQEARWREGPEPQLAEDVGDDEQRLRAAADVEREAVQHLLPADVDLFIRLGLGAVLRAPVRHTEAPSGDASYPMAAGSELMPHLAHF
jgi:hypothetical protein